MDMSLRRSAAEAQETRGAILERAVDLASAEVSGQPGLGRLQALSDTWLSYLTRRVFPVFSSTGTKTASSERVRRCGT